ncbi:hypothetical protein PSE_3115 [Pseudovibrio sp. FO-BEG1]|nr:hypothetical protein PSE_3115 [Pseudovibrio sp. FO-BEG1]
MNGLNQLDADGALRIFGHLHHGLKYVRPKASMLVFIDELDIFR